MNAGKTSATNGSTGVAADLASNCFTFASEAHWQENKPAAGEAVINAVRTFLMNGGNVLAECAAVRTYENTGLFHSSGGINPNTENDFKGDLNTLTFPNADLSYSQFQGTVNIDNGGSLKNWQYLGTLRNNEHNDAAGGTQIGASVAKFRSS